MRGALFWEVARNSGLRSKVHPPVLPQLSSWQPQVKTYDLTFANKITKRLGEVSFNMIAIFRFILELYCKHIEEGGDPLILLGDLVKAFRQMSCEDPDNVLIFECLQNLYQYRTVPMGMTDSTYFLAATLQDVLKDFIDVFLQLFADNYIGVTRDLKML